MIKNAFMWCYRLALLCLAAYALYSLMVGGASALFHNTAFYIPTAMMILGLSSQADMLAAIQRGGMINIKARAIDFIHWFMLVFMAVGRWMIGSISIWMAILTIMLMCLIGWQIGIGMKRQWRPSMSEKMAGACMLVVSGLLGYAAIKTRMIDPSPLGWGWILETTTAIFGTMIFLWSFSNDLRTIRQKASDYPRTVFFKGLFGNAMYFWVVAHMLTNSAQPFWDAVLSSAGFCFNILVGNVIYLIYYLMYEYFRIRQIRAIA